MTSAAPISLPLALASIARTTRKELCSRVRSLSASLDRAYHLAQVLVVRRFGLERVQGRESRGVAKRSEG